MSKEKSKDKSKDKSKEKIKGKDFFSIPQAAKYCSVGRVTFWRWVKSGKIKVSTTLGKRHRIMKKDLERFMLDNGMLELAQHQFAKHRILIVDDDPNILKLFSESFSELDYDTDVAANGFEAGIKVMQFKPSLIILDLVMPEMDGFQVCKMLKKDPATAHIKVIVLTGYGTEENKKKAKEAGADSFFVKPIEEDVLQKHIKNMFKE